MSTAEEIFKKGLDSFRARLSSRENAEFQQTTRKELRSKMAEIQRQQEHNKTTMNMRRLEKFLEGMNQLSKVIEIFLNTNEVVGFVWGPIKLLLVAATGHMEAFDSLLDAYRELGLVLPQLEQYGDIFGAYPDLRTLLAEIYCEILTFHSKSMRFFQAKGLTKTFRALWKNFDYEFKDTLRSIRCYRDAIAEQFVIYSTRSSMDSQSEVRMKVQRCLDYNHELKQKFINLERDRERDEMIKVQEWIQASTFTQEHHQKFRDQRAEFRETECRDTGRWIVDPKKEVHVYKWIKDRSMDQTMMWINGKKGAGKSFLASIIIDECMKEEDAKTSYFYCHESDPNQNTSVAVFKGLLSQLALSCRDLAPCLFAKRAASTLAITSMEAKGLLELFFDKRQYIIIDGIDECEQVEQKQIIQFFADKAAKNQAQGDGKVKVMFVSQSKADIRKALQAPGVNPCIIDLRADDRYIADDICRFVNLRVREMEKKFKFIEPKELNLIKSSCNNGKSHEGMFLFAHLVTHNLLAQPRLAYLIQEARENFPSSLSQAYARIMERMKRELSDPPILWEQAIQLLSWMACAKRPMKWHELQAVMSLTESKIDYRLFSLREDATKLCGSLVHTLGGGRLEFIHNTAKEYLLDPDNDFFHKWDVEIELTIRCLDYLTFDCFAKDLADKDRKKCAEEGQYSLQDYAVSKWMHHLDALMQAMKSSGCILTDEKEIDFGKVLKKFATTYHSGLQRTELNTKEQREKRDRNEVEARQDCAQFQGRPFYDDLLLIWTHVRVHEGASWDIRNQVSIPDLLSILDKNRKVLQSLWQDEKEGGKGKPPSFDGRSEPSQLEEYYGRKFFKCDRVTCDYFWEGFETDADLKRHTNRHDRPFYCVVENCSTQKFGFPSSKDRERHMRTYHPDHPDAGPSPFLQLNRRKVGEAKFGCEHCDKSFTRNINLKSHILSHFGEKPYSCGTCGRCFTRINDCRRHEKIHTRRVK